MAGGFLNNTKSKNKKKNKSTKTPKIKASKKQTAKANKNNNNNNTTKSKSKPKANANSNANGATNVNSKNNVNGVEKKQDKKINNTNQKKTRREELQAMGYVDEAIDKVSLMLPEHADIGVFIDEIEKLTKLEKQEKMRKKAAQQKQLLNDRKKMIGYRLQPESIDAYKSAEGNIFLCIGPRKEKARLSDYNYMKCNVSLKLKLKKKGKKQSSYAAVFIDLRHVDLFELRDIERQKLKIGYENVLSFLCNPNHHIMDIQETHERKLSLDDALMAYRQLHLLRKEDKKVAKLVTAGFDDDEARQALQMSRQDEEKEQEIKNKRKNKKKKEAKSEPKPIAEAKSQPQPQPQPQPQSPKPKSKSKPKASKSPSSNRTVSTNSVSASPPRTVENNINNNNNNNNDDDAEIKDDITCEVMNSCRVNERDMLAVMNDPEIDDLVSGVYVRIRYERNNVTKYRIQCIENTMDYMQQYSFMGVQTIKGLQLSYGNKKQRLKFTYISSDPFTNAELIAWKHKMSRDHKSLPNPQQIDDIQFKINIIKGCVKQQVQSETQNNNKVITTKPKPPGAQPQQPGLPINIAMNINSNQNSMISSAFNGNKSFDSHNYNYSSSKAMNHNQLNQLSAASLAAHTAQQEVMNKHTLLARYLTAIRAGYICYWCIPTSQGDTQYVAFLLCKKQKNESILQEAISFTRDIAFKHGEDSITYCEIREWVIEPDKNKHNMAKNGHYKSKGWLFDCKHKTLACRINTELQHWMPQKVKLSAHCTNFTRLVLQEFGEEYMRIQLLPKSKRPKPDSKLMKKANGPKFDYKNGEPSIDCMSVHMDKVCIYGEMDHSTVGSTATGSNASSDHRSNAPSDISNHSATSNDSYKSNMTAKTNTKYNQMEHMVSPQQHNQNNDNDSNNHKKMAANQKNNNVFPLGALVLYKGTEYNVIANMGSMLLLQNDNDSVYVSNSDYHKLSHAK